MNTKSSPSAYRYCIVRLSTVAVSTLVPALNVLSTTLPESTFLSVVRTNAPPLPGLTCWNSTTVQRSPSRLSTRPFLRSFVVAISVDISFRSGGGRESARSSLPALKIHLAVVADDLTRDVPPVWPDTPAPYGPVFRRLAAGVVGLTGEHTVPGVLGLRALAIGGLL